MQTVTLSLFRFGGLWDRLWVLGQMGAARIDFLRMREAEFWKLCGSGTGEGFTPRPNTAVWAILACWPDLATARDRVAKAPVYARWRARAAEDWTVFLSPQTARGAWAGAAPFRPAPDDTPGPLAALTRATVRPAHLRQFWARVPDISAVIGADPNVAFKIGIGEVPMLHQVTFSIWPDAAAMANFARGDGPHGRAIAAVREHGWFREELYARFRILGAQGQWEGGNPLARLPAPPPLLPALDPAA
ncbi:MAG: spheroidene monooxygenase [Gemmobacter sp.]